jgi:hypothetical protein
MNESKDLKNKWDFTTLKTIRDRVIKKSPHLESNAGRPQLRQTLYQLNYRGQRYMPSS